MKRITIYIAHLLVLVLTGCDKTVLEFPENEGVDPTLVNANLSLAIDPKIEPYEQTGRSEGEVIDAYDVRWIVEVFRDEIGGELAERRVLGCEPAADGHHTIHTSLALHAARYHVVAWMDYVDNGSVDDKYYTIPSLSSISVPAAGNYIGDEDHKDTYVARQEIDLKAHRDRWNETVDVTVTLQRPMAKIEFIATDIDKFLDELAARHSEITGSVADDLLSQTPDLSTIRVQVDYAGYFPSGFNAYTNKPNDARTGMWFECNMTPLTNKEAHLASDYIFVNGSESAVKVDLTIRDSEGNLYGQGLQYGEFEVDHGNRAVRGQQRRARRVFRQREFQSYRFFHETGNPEASFRSAGGKDQRPERNQRRGAEAHGLQCRFQGTAHDVQRPDGRSERIGRRDLYGR